VSNVKRRDFRTGAIDDHGELSAPYVAALAISPAVTAVAAVLYHRTLRDVPVRRTAASPQRRTGGVWSPPATTRDERQRCDDSA
jgi:hypothetical protein